MTQFICSMLSNIYNIPNSLTYNGAISLESSGESLTNLYYKSVRGISKSQYIELLNNAWNSDKLSTLKLIAYIRNIRSGKGERDLGKWALEWLSLRSPQNFKHNLKHYLGIFGRWDDACSLDVDNSIFYIICQTIAEQLILDDQSIDKNISLCAKWIPSEKKQIDKINLFNAKLAEHMCLSRKELRQLLTRLRKKLNLLESKLAEKNIADVDYSKVPSVAMLRHSKKGNAFLRLDKTRFENYKSKLAKGETKVNTGALYSYQIVEQYLNGFVNDKDDLLESQWKSILDKLSEQEKRYLSQALCIVDVSGSMFNGNPSLISVAISLGLMVSEMCPNPSFKHTVLTFSGEPSFYRIEGDSVYQRINSLKRANWGMNTDFEKSYQLILNRAIEFKLTQDQLPTTLIVISDMQFDEASSGKTNFESMKSQFNKHGYKLPNLVFWNVNGSTNDCPISATESNTALISGFSIDILKDVLSGQPITPFSVMMRTINREEYKIISLSE